MTLFASNRMNDLVSFSCSFHYKPTESRSWTVQTSDKSPNRLQSNMKAEKRVYDKLLTYFLLILHICLKCLDKVCWHVLTPKLFVMRSTQSCSSTESILTVLTSKTSRRHTQDSLSKIHSHVVSARFIRVQHKFT